MFRALEPAQRRPQDMGIILICVFGMTTQSAGVERALPIAAGNGWYTTLTREDLPALKLQICKNAYGKKPDMAWIDDGSENVPEDCGIDHG